MIHVHFSAEEVNRQLAERKAKGLGDPSPLCINCAHYRGEVAEVHVCAHPKFGCDVDLVCGGVIESVEDCDLLREDNGRCGEAGKWFNPKV
jgi:hypothetical protein